MYIPRPALLGLSVLALSLAACDSDEVGDGDTITDIVVDDSELSTLEQAVVRAGLADDLGGEGPFTVFAPLDRAFAAVGTPDEVVALDNLADILRLHVVAGLDLDADDLDAGDVLTTLNGETLTVVAVGSGLGLDTEDADTNANALIVDTDIDADNGVIHKIDAVLLPTDN
ncbi:fasciclin domain-containing protein [Rubrivirga litoralis]|uniref:Fasciclin domain-containing protein n=1 Tax=Rubrivirga litoralis TaxID=3075598 RepID=A0ABU3BNE8_9BACT|nr:fasciclin domain-containing protein [Rubrivirga sp. F394]MDT0630798.1 fasciclin domain-containing protein [Rubrivirga sp. F394]